MQVIAIITSLVIAAVIYFVGYIIGGYYSDRRSEDEIIKQKNEISWWKKQTHNTLAEVNEWKDKFSEMQHMYNKERNKVFELTQRLEAYIQGKELGKTIAERNKENIISLFNEGLTDKEIAEAIGCGRSTIQRAIKKFGLR